METIKSIKKNAIFLLALTIIVLYFILKDDLPGVVEALSNTNYVFIIIAVILYFSSIFLRALATYLTIDNRKKISLIEAVKHNTIVQFFNGITPFYVGGQPAEIYMLTKHGLSVSKSTSIVVQNFIFYQTALVIFGILAVIYNGIFHIFPSSKLLEKLVLLGFAINIIVLIALYLVTLCKEKVKKVSEYLLRLLSKLKIIKDMDRKKEQLFEKIDEFHSSSRELCKQKSLFIKGVILNFISLIALYITPLFIAYALHDFTSLTAINTLVTSAYVLIIGAFIPAPGASGGIEYGFISFFGAFLPRVVLNSALLIWRLITYYLGMIAGALLVNTERGESKK